MSQVCWHNQSDYTSLQPSWQSPVSLAPPSPYVVPWGGMPLLVSKDSASTDAQRTSGYQLPNYPIVETASPPRLARSWRTWERTVDPLPFSREERALEPIVPSIPLQREFPCLVGHREGVDKVPSKNCLEAWHRLTGSADLYNYLETEKKIFSFNLIIALQTKIVQIKLISKANINRQWLSSIPFMHSINVYN